MTVTLYLSVLLVTTGLSLALALTTWQRRAAVGAVPFTFFLLAVAVWSFANALEVSSTSLPVKMLWIKVQYVGIISVPPLWLAFALSYMGETRWLTRRNQALLALGSLFTLVILWTNESHRLFWSDLALISYDSLILLDPDHGPYFWLHALSSYSLIGIGNVMLVQRLFRSPPLYRAQVVALLVGEAIPLIANLLYVFGLSPVPQLDPTPLAFGLGALPIAWGLFGFRLLDVVPLARNVVVESMNDGILVLDRQERVVSINPAGERLLEVVGAETIGQPATEIFPTYTSLRQAAPGATLQGEVRTEGARTIEYHQLPLVERSGAVGGWLLVLSDVTERKRAEIERDHLIAQLRDSLFRTQALYRATRSMIGLESLPTILQAVVDGVVEALTAERVLLVTIDQAAQQIEEMVWAGTEVTLAPALDYADLTQGIYGRVLRERRLVRRPKRHLPPRGAIMVVPLLYRDEVVGLMSAVQRVEGRDFSRRDEQLLAAMANQAAVAIANTRLFREVQRLAITDDLTALPNRRHFLELAEREFQRVQRTGEPLSALLFDIDDFKEVNDRFGHAIGDEVLSAVAASARKHVREVDMVGRYGGEEFAVLLPNSDLAAAHRVAERLRHAIEATPVQTGRGLVRVTISVGAAQATWDVVSVAALIDRADRAMYAAKAAGRNRVAVG